MIEKIFALKFLGIANAEIAEFFNEKGLRFGDGSKEWQSHNIKNLLSDNNITPDKIQEVRLYAMKRLKEMGEWDSLIKTLLKENIKWQ